MQALIDVKFWSGLILEQLNKSRSFVTRDSQVLQAHPMCVEAQIEQLMIANDEALLPDNRVSILQRVADMNWFSFARWPCDNHIDMFDKTKDESKGVPALENKIVLWNPAVADRCGRGGFGPGKCAYALLDWPAHVTNRQAMVREVEGNRAPERIRRTWFEAWAAGHNVTRVTNPEVFPPPQNN